MSAGRSFRNSTDLIALETFCLHAAVVIPASNFFIVVSRMGSDRRGETGSHWDEIHRIMEASSLTNELMAGIAAQYGGTLHPPYERSLDELREIGYRELQMEISFLQPPVSFADIAYGHGNELIAEGGDSMGEMGIQTINRRIEFNRFMCSMQVVEFEHMAPRNSKQLSGARRSSIHPAL